MGKRLLLRVLALAGVAYGVTARLAHTGPVPVRTPPPLAPPERTPESLVHRETGPVTPVRLLLGAAGVLAACYGAFRILSQPGTSHPIALAIWLAVAVALHDGVLVPGTLLVGAVLARAVPPRARPYVQGALVSSALVTAFTIPLAYRRGSAPGVKALEGQDYLGHLALVVAVIAVGAALAYGVRVVRDRRGPATGPRAVPLSDA